MSLISSLSGSLNLSGKPSIKTKGGPSSLENAKTVEVFPQAAAFLDLSTRGRLEGGGPLDKPLSGENAKAVAAQLGKMIQAGVIGWEWRKDEKGVLHRVFLENTVAGLPEDYKPLKPGDIKGR